MVPEVKQDHHPKFNDPSIWVKKTPEHYPYRFYMKDFSLGCELYAQCINKYPESEFASNHRISKSLGWARELEILKACGQHQNIVQLIQKDFIIDPLNTNLKYFVTKWIPQTLSDFVDGFFSQRTEKQLELASDILQGIEHLHRKEIIHANINPKCILTPIASPAQICAFKTSWLPKETPIGSVNMKEISYLAPEIVKGDVYDNKVDLWGFAATMLSKSTTALSPINIDRIRRHVNKKGNEYELASLASDAISPNLSKILRKCVEETPADRLSASDCLLKLSRKRKHENVDDLTVDDVIKTIKEIRELKSKEKLLACSDI